MTTSGNNKKRQYRCEPPISDKSLSSFMKQLICPKKQVIATCDWYPESSYTCLLRDPKYDDYDGSLSVEQFMFDHLCDETDRIWYALYDKLTTTTTREGTSHQRPKLQTILLILGPTYHITLYFCHHHQDNSRKAKARIEKEILHPHSKFQHDCICRVIMVDVSRSHSSKMDRNNNDTANHVTRTTTSDIPVILEPNVPMFYMIGHTPAHVSIQISKTDQNAIPWSHVLSSEYDNDDDNDDDIYHQIIYLNMK